MLDEQLYEVMNVKKHEEFTAAYLPVVARDVFVTDSCEAPECLQRGKLMPELIKHSFICTVGPSPPAQPACS